MSLVGFEPDAIRLSGQVLDQWPRSLKCRKQVEKLGFYTFLSVISGESYFRCVRKQGERLWVFTQMHDSRLVQNRQKVKVNPFTLFLVAFFQSQFSRE